MNRLTQANIAPAADILTGAEIHADSNRIFSPATGIIDVYLLAVESDLQLPGQWQDKDLEHWLQSV